MASTNKTTHYNLSQYIGTDKPTYLVDYNQDMERIDTGIYGADSKATLNTSSIGTLSNLTTSVKTDLVSAVNEVNSSAVGVGDISQLTTSDKTSVVAAVNEVDGDVGNLTSLNTVNKTSLVAAVNEVDGDVGNLANLTTQTQTSLVGAVNEVNSNLGDFEDYFKLTDNRKLTNPTIIRGGGTIEAEDIRVALNSDGTLGKIYGRIAIRGQNNYGIVKYTNTGIMGVTETFGISPAGVSYATPVSGGYEVDSAQIFINPPATGETSASIEVRMGNWSSDLSLTCLMPCIYFFNDFGDTI